MEVTQSPDVVKGVHVARSTPRNPTVSPKRSVCLINNLPPEVLSHIFKVGIAHGSRPKREGEVKNAFKDCFWYPERKELYNEHICGIDDEIDSDSESGSSSGFSSPQPLLPILVSRVCSHWRSIALSTPSLWTRIEVPCNARPPYEHVSKMLERSKDHAIDLCVSCIQPGGCGAYVEAPDDADLRFLFTMLIPHIHRWRSVEVTVLDHHKMHVILGEISDLSLSVTQLRTFYLSSVEGDVDDIWHPNMSKRLPLFGGTAPLLTRLILWGVYVDWDKPWITSAYNLKELELAFHVKDACLSWTQFASILRSAPGLEKLGLRQSGPSGEPAEWFIQPTAGGLSDLNDPIQLPRVTHFVLAFYSPSRAVGLIHKLYLPALKNLTLDLYDGDYSNFVYKLAGPTTSLSPSNKQSHSLLSRLETLKVVRLRCRQDCLRSLYGELENLRSLNITLKYLPPIFLEMLGTPCTLPARGGIWLPRLETMYISSWQRDTLREVVQKRIQAGVPIHSLHLESLDLGTQELEWLQENVETIDFLWLTDYERSTDSEEYDDLDEDMDAWSDEDE